MAFAAEAAISFGMMLLVLSTSNVQRLARFTGAFAGVLIALYITIEDPLSGTSMNPGAHAGPRHARPHRPVALRQRIFTLVSPNVVALPKPSLAIREAIVVRDPDGHGIRLAAR